MYHVVIHVHNHEGRICHYSTKLAGIKGSKMLCGFEMNAIVKAIKHLRIRSAQVISGGDQDKYQNTQCIKPAFCGERRGVETVRTPRIPFSGETGSSSRHIEKAYGPRLSLHTAKLPLCPLKEYLGFRFDDRYADGILVDACMPPSTPRCVASIECYI